METTNFKDRIKNRVRESYGISNKDVCNSTIMMNDDMHKLNNAICILKVKYANMLSTFELYNVHKVIDTYGPMVITEPLFPIGDEETNNPQIITHVGDLYFPNINILEQRWFRDGLSLIEESPTNLKDSFDILYGESIDKTILHIDATLEDIYSMNLVGTNFIVRDKNILCYDDNKYLSKIIRISTLSGDVKTASTLFASSMKDNVDDIYHEYLDNFNQEVHI